MQGFWLQYILKANEVVAPEVGEWGWGAGTDSLPGVLFS